jgi:hypothetical protein
MPPDLVKKFAMDRPLSGKDLLRYEKDIKILNEDELCTPDDLLA